jgi:predicted GIY-YIG superfamily endonuclease
MTEKEVVVYCIISKHARFSYVGVTADFERRLRQHRREIVGGARATKRKHARWRPFYVISGFPNRTTALQMEWRLHHPVKAYKQMAAPKRRAMQLCDTLGMERGTAQMMPMDELVPQLMITWYDASFDHETGYSWPDDLIMVTI